MGRVGELIAQRYRLEELIARGGMAEVWEAHDLTLDRRVAVKILHAHLADDAGFVSRFRREALAIARLSHPNVVAVFDTGVDAVPAGRPGSGRPRAYIVMELVRGSSVRALLQRGVMLSSAVSIAAGAADGLAFAHRHGLVHRDVKPANILVQPDGRVKVVDFGIAKVAQGPDRPNEDLTQAGAILGTAKYLAPEQVEGLTVDARADIYALGVVLYEMVCGRPPFTGANDLATALQHVRATPIAPRQVRAGIPRALEQVILRSMARVPDDRFPNASALATALRAIDLDDDDAVAAVTRTDADRTPPRGLDATTRIAATTPGRADTTDATSVTTARQPRATARRRGRFGAVGLVLALLGIGAGAAAGVLGATVTHDRSVGSPLPVGAVESFDPLGDNRENDPKLPNLVDGNRSTTWTTEGYGSRSFSGKKPGVGVILRVDGTKRVRHLRVVSPTRGWTARVYMAGAVGTTLDDWGSPAAEIGPVTNETTTATLGRVRGAQDRFVLLWITDLGPRTTDLARVVIAELSPRG